ncbi:hypothetical protein L1887_02920 [Cichorium endivia]|nr:hypothetical protein L1887_02920 [Cichorium endivia]
MEETEHTCLREFRISWEDRTISIRNTDTIKIPKSVTIENPISRMTITWATGTDKGDRTHSVEPIENYSSTESKSEFANGEQWNEDILGPQGNNSAEGKLGCEPAIDGKTDMKDESRSFFHDDSDCNVNFTEKENQNFSEDYVPESFSETRASPQKKSVEVCSSENTSPDSNEQEQASSDSFEQSLEVGDKAQGIRIDPLNQSRI